MSIKKVLIKIVRFMKSPQTNCQDDIDEIAKWQNKELQKIIKRTKGDYFYIKNPFNE